MEIDAKTILAALAVLFSIGGYFPYLRDVLLKRTKPHVYTWLIWCLTQGTAVAGIWYGGGGQGALGLTIGVFFVFLVFLASIKLGTRNITVSDTIVLIAALAAILVWWRLHDPLLAVFMASAIDVLGYIPSWRKSVTQPWEETLWSWTAFTVGNVFALFALVQYNLLTTAYITAISIANMILIVICLYYRTKIAKPT